MAEANRDQHGNLFALSTRRADRSPAEIPNSMRITQHALLLFGLATAGFLTACSSSDDAVPASPKNVSNAPTERAPIDPGTTGTLMVVVELEDEAPPLRELDIGREPACAHDGPVFSEFVVAADGKLANALVRVTSGHERWIAPAPSEAPTVLSQNGCIYRPHVLGIRVGTTLLVENGDDLVHNVHVVARKNNPSNQVQTAGAAALEFEFRRPELSISIQCDIHPWMGAWLHVVDHPWFAVSDATGLARIEDLPPGQYQVEVLHEKFGSKTIQTTLEPNGSKELRVSFGQ